MKSLASKLATLVLSTALLPSCIETGSKATHSNYSNHSSVSEATIQRSHVRVAFDPENQVLPFPNNLLFEANATSAEDLNGTLNVPISDPESPSALVSKALNDLDGFATTASWRFAFSGAVDQHSLIIGTTIRVFEMAEVSENYPQRIRPQMVERELSHDDIAIEYFADNYVVKLRPLNR